MKIKIHRTNSENKDFIGLVGQLDAYLKIMDGEEHEFYKQFNTIETLKYVVILYVDDTPAACGAFRGYTNEIAEIKRMYVVKDYRRKGFAQNILTALENWAKEEGYSNCMLETGKRMTDAITFYVNNKYQTIPNYGQYKHKGDSVCFQKQLP